MATGSEDFSGYTLSTLASQGWTVFRNVPSGSGAIEYTVETNADMPGGRQVHVFEPTSTSWCGITLDSLPDALDWETLTLCRRSGTNGAFHGQIQRVTATTAYCANLTHTLLDHRAVELNGSGQSDLAIAAHGVNVNNAWHWRRYRTIGNVLQIRLWAADLLADDLGLSNEPGTWGIDHTDSTRFTVAGKAGFILRGRNAGDDGYWGYFGWATDGDVAPGPFGGSAASPKAIISPTGNEMIFTNTGNPFIIR